MPIVRALIAVLLVIGQGPLASSQSPSLRKPSTTNACPTIQTCFSPGGHCSALINAEIAAAHHTVLVQAYHFTNAEIAEALIAAKRRGLRVEVLIDRQRPPGSRAEQLRAAGVVVLIDKRHSIAHNKVMVLDDEVVITGSFNFTEAAERKNAENVVILRDKETARRYAENWAGHKMHSS